MAYGLAAVILQFGAAKAARAITNVATTEYAGLSKAVAVTVLVFNAKRVAAVPARWLAIVTVLARCTKAIWKIEAGPLFYGFGAGLTAVV
jgi:hypothetical protein